MKRQAIFLKNFIKNPRQMGSITPSSRILARSMVKDINFNEPCVIVEYGPGEGVFTKNIINQLNEDSVFVIIEVNIDFYRKLKEAYSDLPNVHVFLESVCQTDKILEGLNIDKVDYIVSGIPFSSISSQLSKDIIEVTSKILADHGVFITFQYTNTKMSLFSTSFKTISVSKVWRNFPPAFIFTCSNRPL